MHQIRFPLGSTPDPAGRAYSAPPDLSDVFKGSTSKGREGYKEEREREGGGKGKDKGKRRGNEVNGKGSEGKGRGRKRERKGREGEGKGFAGPVSNCFLRSRYLVIYQFSVAVVAAIRQKRFTTFFSSIVNSDVNVFARGSLRQ